MSYEIDLRGRYGWTYAVSISGHHAKYRYFDEAEAKILGEMSGPNLENQIKAPLFRIIETLDLETHQYEFEELRIDFGIYQNVLIEAKLWAYLTPEQKVLMKLGDPTEGLLVSTTLVEDD